MRCSSATSPASWKGTATPSTCSPYGTYLVLDWFIESPTPVEPSPIEAPVNIHADAEPALGRVLRSFLDALDSRPRERPSA